MSTYTTSPRRLADRFSTRKLLMTMAWIIVLSCIGYFFFGVVSSYIHFDALHYGFFWPSRWWLASHLGFGALALLLGPIQFISSVRQRSPRVHHWIGRLYLIGVLGGSVSAIYMSFFVDASQAAGLSLFFLAVAWLITSFMAYITAVRRRFIEHREWMIRSYTVTLAFVTYRLLAPVPFFFHLGPELSATTRGWLCWSIPLLVTDMILGWTRMNSRRQT
jgi:uncharacterized membrane protein HdeD (DUF308 family)